MNSIVFGGVPTMATGSHRRTGMTLEEFLRWPRIDEKPYLEYHDGRIEVKVSPQRKHGVIEVFLTQTLNAFARPRRLGFACVELRCTFAGRSIIPDVVFHLKAHIPLDDLGNVTNESLLPPDIHVEVRSPDQSAKKTRAKIEHSIANGCPLAWYIDPDDRTVEVFRPGRPPERLSVDGVLDGAPVLPGFLLPVSEMFGWFRYDTIFPAEPG